MPRYEYECESCGIHFERFQSFNDEPLAKCPECGGRVHRVISPVGIIFKGSGFYVTDNRSAPSAEAERRTKASEGKTDSAGED